MDKYLKMWEPVLKSFEGNYEAMQLKGNDARKLKKEEELKEVTEHVVDWYPSGYLEITVTMSDSKIYLYDFINNRIIPIRKRSNIDELRDDISRNEESWRKNFSKRLKIRMSRKGVSQDRLSEMTGISKVTLSKYMNGLASPSGYNLERLSRSLGCSVSELVSVY